MGRKQDNKKDKKHQKQEQEQEIEDQQVQEQDSEDEDEMDDGEFDDEIGDDIDGDEIILQKIQDKIVEADEEEKLSWAAIYHIKKEEAAMNEEMQKQIENIREKYEIKKAPLINKISDAVAGKKLEKSVYANNQLIKSINLNKTKPKVLKDYWGKVFDSCGLISNEEDIELLEKLTVFRCELIDPKVQHIRLIFEFEENQFFGNKILVEVSGSVSESAGSFSKKLQVTKKKAVDENSLFGLLTGKDSDDQQLLETCHDLYKAYGSSTYFYFYEPSDDLDEEGLQNDEQDEEQSQEDIKPVKKPKGSAIQEKPECKQQ